MNQNDMPEAGGDEALLLAILSGASVKVAARQSGMSPSTAHRRLASPAFASRLNKLRQVLVSKAIVVLADSAMEAAFVLKNEMRRGDTSSERSGAAKAVLDRLHIDIPPNAEPVVSERPIDYSVYSNEELEQLERLMKKQKVI